MTHLPNEIILHILSHLHMPLIKTTLISLCPHAHLGTSSHPLLQLFWHSIGNLSFLLEREKFQFWKEEILVWRRDFVGGAGSGGNRIALRTGQLFRVDDVEQSKLLSEHDPAPKQSHPIPTTATDHDLIQSDFANGFPRLYLDYLLIRTEFFHISPPNFLSSLHDAITQVTSTLSFSLSQFMALIHCIQRGDYDVLKFYSSVFVDHELIRYFIYHEPWILAHLPEIWRSDRDIVSLALHQNWRTIDFVSAELMNDVDFIVEVILIAKRCKQHVTNAPVAQVLIRPNIPKTMRRNSELYIKLIPHFGLDCLSNAAETLKNNERLILDLAQKYGGIVLNYAAKPLKQRKSFAKKVMDMLLDERISTPLCEERVLDYFWRAHRNGEIRRKVEQYRLQRK
mmetsp:Transcript_11458/g.43025  ORF Transcript_11458/g.43025 Transcript_11458/m.43025 type:complete len:396 (-) Transcript_11458:11-1198(-)